jgi:tetratricopeptide (TPR) repeat protein
MSDASTRPVIFISYAHADEPEKPGDGEVQWLSFVRTFLQPAVTGGVFDLWVDRHMSGGVKWEKEIEDKLRRCDIFILLVSPRSMASDYVVDKEIAIIRERQDNGDDVHFYPLLLRPTPKVALDKVRDLNLRPRDAKPFSGYSVHDREQHMTDAADEIAEIAGRIAGQKRAAQPGAPGVQPAYVHINGLPETAYERLVGRDAELKRLDDAWADHNTNILSLVAEGGAGKSALVNEWLKRMQADGYRSAEAVLGWSFYSQGTEERATAADAFLNWALDRLGVRLDTTSATVKGDAIAEALAQRRVLLVLDGVEPLQHGLGTQQGELKDPGLRALLRRFAAMPPAGGHGLVVLTSRLAVKDVARWKDSVAPVLDVEELSDEAGAALLRDNGVWGADTDLRAASLAFGGLPLALGLLASFLKETQYGDVRRRDHVRAFFADPENPRHDHARRVMESYEKEWLAGQPVALAIMHMVGLFDRPASGDCLAALRGQPAIRGLTDALVDLDETGWRRAVARLRDVRLLAPEDAAAPDTLDAHPLVREWFGLRLEQTNLMASRAAHGRLYEHLRDAPREWEAPTLVDQINKEFFFLVETVPSTQEDKLPTLEDLAPLYQAISHGCRASRHQEALNDVYEQCICRRQVGGEMDFYASKKLGATGSNLTAVSWFFKKPYEMPVVTFTLEDRAWLLGQAAFLLIAQGRFTEALPASRAELRIQVESKRWGNAALAAFNLSDTQELLGEVDTSVALAQQSIDYADKSGDEIRVIQARVTYADSSHIAGRREEAERIFIDAEDRQQQFDYEHPLLYSVSGYLYCDLLLAKGEWAAARDRASRTLEWVRPHKWLLDVALDTLTIGRAHLGLALSSVAPGPSATVRDDAGAAHAQFGGAVEGLHAAGRVDYFPLGLLARAAFRRSVGDWDGAARDLDEVEEIAEPGPMRLYLCDVALERARLAFARIEAFAPLNGLIDDGPPPPVPPATDETVKLAQEARDNLATARDLITRCGYHKRDEELAELEAVRDGQRRFADLPPRV